MRSSTPECITKLRAVYNTLRPKPALVADYIFEHPNDVVSHSIGDLARMVGVSQFSVINCIKAAGYSGFSDFKIALAKSIGQEDVLLFGSLAETDTPYAVLCNVFQQRAKNLIDSIQLIGQTSFDAAVAMILAAQKVVLFGQGYSCFAAEYLSFNLERLGLNTVFHRDTVFQGIVSELLTEQDLAIAFTATGQASTALRALSEAKRSGCATIVITSAMGASVQAYADCTLLTTYSDPDILQDTNNAIIEQIALAAAITLSVASSDKIRAIERITRSSVNTEL